MQAWCVTPPGCSSYTRLQRLRQAPACAQFFGCYFNLFRLMAKCGGLGNLLVKEHTHTFVNAGGDVRALDFRFNVGGRKIGAPFHGLKAFFTTAQLAPIDKACARGSASYALEALLPRRGCGGHLHSTGQCPLSVAGAWCWCCFF